MEKGRVRVRPGKGQGRERVVFFCVRVVLYCIEFYRTWELVYWSDGSAPVRHTCTTGSLPIHPIVAAVAATTTMTTTTTRGESMVSQIVR